MSDRLHHFPRSSPDMRANSIVLALYLSFIFICQIVVSRRYHLFYLIFGSCIWLLLTLIIAPMIIHRVSRIYINDEYRFHLISGRNLWVLFYGIPLIVLLVYYIAYYPGGFAPDSFWQYEQAVTGRYNNWHPVLQTLFAFWIPLTISNGWIGSVSLFQILVLSASLGYCFDTIYKIAGRNYLIGSMVFILCNPLICIAVVPFKDVSFATGALLLLTFSLKIIVSAGLWLKKPFHAVCFIVVFVSTTLFRHNAVLFTAPLLFAVFFQISRKQFLILLTAIATLFFSITGLLYTGLYIEKPDNRQVETLGLPMTVIGAAVTYVPDTLDEDILEFAYRIAPPDIWEEYYTIGDFNTFKFQPETDIGVVEEYGTKSILNMMLRCFKASPWLCFSSMIKLTEGVYTVTDPHPVTIVPGIAANDYGITKAAANPLLTLFLFSHSNFVQDFFPHVFLFYGVSDLIVIVSALSKCRLNKLKDWKKLLFAVPLFSYNFGTSLLLTGSSDSPRFFYYTVLILPVLLVIFYRREEVAV